MVTPTPVPIMQEMTIMEGLDPWMILVIIVGSFVTLFFSLGLVYYFVLRLPSSVHRQLLHDSVYESRLRLLMEQRGLDEQLVIYEVEDPSWLQTQRQDAEDTLRSLNERLAVLNDRQQREGNLSPEDREELEQIQRRIHEIEQDLDGHLSETRIANIKERIETKQREREERLNEVRREASEQANTMVPQSLTAAGMGITGTFFIELTAILTIIFGVVILGLVGVLGSREVATILAAIAGYVLGRAASSTASREQQRERT